MFSANNAPWLASGPGDSARRDAFPAWLGAEDDLTNRALRAEALMNAAPAIDDRTLWRIKSDKTVDQRSTIGRFVRAALALDVGADSDLAAAQALLRRWDWRFDGRGAADGFTHEFLRPVSRLSYARLPLPAPEEALRDASAYLRARYGRIDVPLAQMLVLRRGNRSVPAAGGPDVLRALVSYGEAEGEPPKAVFGDSFVMLIEWDAAGRLTVRTVVP